MYVECKEHRTFNVIIRRIFLTANVTYRQISVAKRAVGRRFMTLIVSLVRTETRSTVENEQLNKSANNHSFLYFASRVVG